jgi:hypothetical protein
MSENFDKFQEYKFFAESTQFLTERRQSATQTYLSVNTGLIAVIGFILNGEGTENWALIIACIALMVAGALACSIWYKIIKQYKDLINWRFSQLMKMETEIPNCHQMYRKEFEEFYNQQTRKERFGFSRLEKWLPWLFLGLYLIYGTGVIVLKLCN